MPAANSFNDIIRLTDREIQILLRECDGKDLIYGLKGCRKEVRERFLSNMSKRVRQSIEKEVRLAKPNPGEVKDVRERIVQQIWHLVEQGQITWPPPEGAKARFAIKMKKPSKKQLDERRRLNEQVKLPLSELSYDQINDVFVGLAETARREGILALDSLAQVMTDPFMKDAVQLAVDGTEPDLIMDILKTWMESLVHEQETKYKKVIEAIMAIQSGDNPRIVAHKLEVIF